MMLPAAAEQALGQGIAALPFAVSDQQVERFRTYLQLLNRWNAVHNLTAVRDPREQVIVHLLDCLAVLPHIAEHSQTLADIGSGAGLPALVIAVMRPQLRVFAVESNHKKAAFIRQAANQLHLPQVSVVSERVESWQPEHPLGVIISRAMAAPETLLTLTRHLGDAHSRWLLMCGLAPAAFNVPGFTLDKQTPIDVPLLEASRTLLVMAKGERHG